MKYDNLNSIRPVAHKSEVVGQDVGVVYVWVCLEVGAVTNKLCFFRSYLHNHIPLPHILKLVTCKWQATYTCACTTPKATLQTLFNVPFCTYLEYTIH